MMITPTSPPSSFVKYEGYILTLLLTCTLSNCTAPNPDYSEEAVLAEGMIDVSGGESSSAGITAGETSAGETISGGTTAGETSAGEVVSGGVSAGETTAGETLPGGTTGGEINAGEMMAGEIAEIDEDRDGFSPPMDCNDQDPQINPEATETCNGQDDDCDGEIDEGTLNACGQCGTPPVEQCDLEDNDCDGQIDEGTLNACGFCGQVPPEICDGQDNDCDGQLDEGTLNACGLCGQVPTEVCDGRDNDCDGQLDEGTLNACGQCGQAPAEVCDGIDNNCDGRTDEGLLNACGQCGPLPSETCDQVDNDCDGQVDEGTLNVCGQCGPVPSESCDGVDNDCDGVIDENLALNSCGLCGDLPIERCDGTDNDCDGEVDEDLFSPCFTLKHTIVPNSDIIEMGSLIRIVGDLNGDGVSDAVVRSERLGRVRVNAYSGDGTLLWSITGDGGFATDVASGTFFGESDLYLAVNDPENDRFILYNSQGAPYIIVNVPEGEVASLETIRGYQDTLVYSVPSHDGGALIRRLGFDQNNPTSPRVIFTVYGDPDDITAERMYNIGDLIGNFAEDLMVTRSFIRQNGEEDIGTVLMDGSTGRMLSESLYTPAQNSNLSFASDVTMGSFETQGNLSFAYGAPLVSNRIEDQGAVYFLHERFQGFSSGPPLFGGVQGSGIGLQLETLPRPLASADTLVIGGFGQLTYRDYSDFGQRVPVPLPNHNLYIGSGLAIAETPSEDGTYQMWVSGMSDVGGESRVWILRAR